MNKIFKKNFTVKFLKFEDSMVLVNNDQVYKVNDLSFSIWNSLDGIKTQSEVVKLIHEEYEVDNVELERDCSSFFKLACEEGLIIEIEDSKEETI